MIYAILAAVSVALILSLWKIILMRKAARDIGRQMEEKLNRDTNTIITLDSSDSVMCDLADTINRELCKLREAYLRYHTGDREVKEAVTNISHDLRTPLTAICGYLDLLHRTSDPQKQAEYLAIIEERAEIMRQLTEELFRYSVILSNESMPMEDDVLINQVLEESIAGAYPALSARGIEPQVEITETRVERRSNRAAVARVFNNLLNNAVKYSEGDLAISLTEDGTVRFSNKASALSADAVAHLFDRFYTQKASRDSTGLGLSIAKALTERMNGSISAEYEGECLTICVRF
ncbi:MAG: HAMP domain-containing histidine kinase [Lachnospiraceae bacterium]|nr:HAMP domain-containing histidine kinase [Lachnospiraceae bacterium]